MSQLVIEVDSPTNEALLVQLVNRLNARIVSKTDTAVAQKQKALATLQRVADRGGATSFSDASEWQREVRSWGRA